MQQSVHVPIISIIDAAVQKLVKRKKCIPLILGTPYSQEFGLYQSYLRSIGLQYVEPMRDDVAVVFKIIQRVLAGESQQSLADKLTSIIYKYPQTNTVILGCTELSVLAKRIQTPKLKIDPLQTLAEKVVAECKK